MVNPMLHKTPHIHLRNSCLVITNDKQYYVCPIDMEIMKCLVSKGHYCSLSGALYPMQGSNDCLLALYFNNYHAINAHCSISVNNISKSLITQLISNHHLMAIKQPSAIECKWPGYTSTKDVIPLLALITMREGCFIVFIIPVVNSFTSKISIALWGLHFDPFQNLSDLFFNFKSICDFKLTNLAKTYSHLVPIVSFMNTLEEIVNNYNMSFPCWLIII